MLEDSKFCLLIGQLRVSHLFRNGGDEPWLVSSYETKPQRGWMKRPKVPRTHTVTNTQRKILSITMATYFQSSSTCEQGREQDQWVWDDRGKCQQWQMQDEKWGGTWGKVHSERKRVSQNLSEGGRFVGVDGEDYPAGMARRNETKKERKELNISCKPTVNWYKIYTGRNYYDNHIQPTASNESTGVLTKLIEPRVLHIKGCFPPLGDFTHCI